MKKIFQVFSLLTLNFLLSTGLSSAHCPLCTIGAGAVAVGASFLGVKDIVTGVFVGAFALALGLWSTKLVRKKLFRWQDEIIVLIIFFSTILPISRMIKGYLAYYINLGGTYGSIFNRTYVINAFVAGSLIGALIMLISPWISRKLKSKFGYTIPFQTMAIIFSLLIIFTVILQLTVSIY